MKRINASVEEVIKQWYKWMFSNPRTERFGQWFCNRCLIADISWPELFYEEDSVKAFNMAYAEACKGLKVA